MKLTSLLAKQLNFAYQEVKGLNFRMRKFSYLIINPSCTIILPSNQPVPFPYHPVLWQEQLPCAYQP